MTSHTLKVIILLGELVSTIHTHFKSEMHQPILTKSHFCVKEYYMSGCTPTSDLTFVMCWQNKTETNVCCLLLLALKHVTGLRFSCSSLLLIAMTIKLS